MHTGFGDGQSDAAVADAVFQHRTLQLARQLGVVLDVVRPFLVRLRVVQRIGVVLRGTSVARAP
jgi:hypothetical protein